MAKSASISLLGSKRFLPLLLTKVSGVFNDNFFKNSLIFGLLYGVLELGHMDSDILITLSAGLLVLPFFLFSAFAGQLADKYQKEKIIQNLKLAEIGIALLGIIGLSVNSPYILLSVLFLFGTQSAFLNPCKYAILPQHLKEDELVAGNGLLSAGTFLSILAGTMAGGGFVMIPLIGPYIVMGALLVTAVAGYAISTRVPPALPGDKALRVEWNIPSEIYRNLVYAFSRPREIRLSIIGISWFYFVGGTFLAQFPNYAKDYLQVDESVLMSGLILFSVGISAGSIMNDKLLGGRIEATYVPVASLGISLFSMILAHINVPDPVLADGQLYTLRGFFSAFNAPLIFAALFLVAFCGGLFVVPLNALIQHLTSSEHRARIMAASGIVNAAFMVASSLLCLVILKLGFGVEDIFLFLSIASFFASFYVCNLLPAQLMKTILQFVFRSLFRIEVHGIEHLKESGERALIVSNHASLLDAPILAAFLPGKPMFALNTRVAQWWWVKPWLKLVDAFPIDPTNPYSIKALVEELKKGKHCVIFPEGRLSTTGALMKIYDGPGMIADKADAKIVPVHLSGVQYAPTSQLKGKLPRRLFPKITMTIFEPFNFLIPDDIKGRKRRRVAARMLHDEMENIMFLTQERHKTLFEELLHAKKLYGASMRICEDAQGTTVTYKKLVLGSLVLGREIARLTQKSDSVGVLLPNSVGAVVTFFALQAFGRVPAMLNFSVGSKAVFSACQSAKIQTILTSRKFIEMGQLQDLDQSLNRDFNVVYLEDLRETITILAKLRGLLGLPFAHSIHNAHAISPKDPATVLFTSGSEGVPKGVVLSHLNFMSNIAQLRCRIDFNCEDVVFNCLPMFHSFGLTGATLLPVLSGVKTFLYPSPLHLRIVPEMIYATNATIMFGTDTFLRGYARVAHPYDFYRMRYIFAGAEKVKDETRQSYMNQFGVRILEGYGATEASPVIAVNSPMHQKPGRVGRLLSAIQYKLEPVAGVEHGGRLLIKGPNIMLGYYMSDQPGVLQPPAGGWHDTGDIVVVDEEGYVEIQGRAKRFAKIGGEMISLVAVENMAHGLWPEREHAVISIPDAKKGEQLVLFTTQEQASKKELLAYAKEQGITELSVPKVVHVIQKLPVLGTGKVDYPALERMV